MRSHKAAMAALAAADARREAEDDYARRNRTRHPLEALCTAPVATRYSTHERVYWTEDPAGKPLARPLYPTESDGFIRSLETEERYRMPERKYRTVGEVAEMLEVSRNAVHDAIDRGELHAFSPGKVKRILLSELTRYLQAKGYKPEHIADITSKWEASVSPTQATQAIGCA